MKIKSNLKPREYTPDEVCRIVNWKQSNLYIKNRVFPIDIYPSVDRDGKDVTVFIYLREETKELYELWKNYELK